MCSQLLEVLAVGNVAVHGVSHGGQHGIGHLLGLLEGPAVLHTAAGGPHQVPQGLVQGQALQHTRRGGGGEWGVSGFKSWREGGKMGRVTAYAIAHNADAGNLAAAVAIRPAAGDELLVGAGAVQAGYQNKTARQARAG